MKSLYTEEEYYNAKSEDKLKIECYGCGKIYERHKKHIKHELKSNKGEIKYCSLKCYYKQKDTSFEINCTQCGKTTFKREYEIKKNKSKNVFCSKSCAVTYNNTHKKYGSRRSKLEKWIEEELRSKYDFEIVFNGKEEINSELDIYIPHLKLAIELNGIFHYEPIYGEEKLKNIKNNDNRKFQACLEKKIELCIIDVSGSKHFKKDRDIKYLDVITKLMDNKIKNENKV